MMTMTTSAEAVPPLPPPPTSTTTTTSACAAEAAEGIQGRAGRWRPSRASKGRPMGWRSQHRAYLDRSELMDPFSLGRSSADLRRTSLDGVKRTRHWQTTTRTAASTRTTTIARIGNAGCAIGHGNKCPVKRPTVNLAVDREANRPKRATEPSNGRDQTSHAPLPADYLAVPKVARAARPRPPSALTSRPPSRLICRVQDARHTAVSNRPKQPPPNRGRQFR